MFIIINFIYVVGLFSYKKNVQCLLIWFYKHESAMRNRQNIFIVQDFLKVYVEQLAPT